MILMGFLHGDRLRDIGHCLVSTGRLVCGKGRPGTLETEEECTAYRKGEGLRAHAELLKWGNIPESELCGV